MPLAKTIKEELDKPTGSSPGGVLWLVMAAGFKLVQLVTVTINKIKNIREQVNSINMFYTVYRSIKVQAEIRDPFILHFSYHHKRSLHLLESDH